MSQSEFNHLLQSVAGLTPDQLRQLRRTVDGQLATSAPAAEQDFGRELTKAEANDQDLQRRLFAAGVISEIKPSIPAEPSQNSPTEPEFKQRLMQAGLMTVLPTPVDPASRREFVPIRIEGEPLSETIIRERR